MAAVVVRRAVFSGRKSFTAISSVQGQGCLQLPHHRLSTDTPHQTSADSTNETEDTDMPQRQMEDPYKEEVKRCILCNVELSYKNPQLLSQFLSPYTGRIYGHHITGLCDKKQAEVERQIRNAQYLGFLPVMHKDPIYWKDPKIFSAPALQDTGVANMSDESVDFPLKNLPKKFKFKRNN
uniref:Small ribosomal subunit protein bS18m n=1 Tax=Branchiostoma belcheri tsingtauense TaxID=155462 RepID=Q86QR9_BRABE|nr:mitochondrial ribosomal protein S18C [Branchiostoma belcheri tsingtauense]